MDNNERMTTWCRMWSEDPTLARQLMTDDCVQWSAQTEGLDGVVGPEAAITAMNAYRELHVNVFTPRILVDGGDTFAYLWDVVTPDGEVRTGLDVNVLRDGMVAENWTFVTGRDDHRGSRPAHLARRSRDADVVAAGHPVVRLLRLRGRVRVRMHRGGAS